MEPASDKTMIAPRAGLPTDLFQTGEVVGQYRVDKVLGAGGMGVVYLVKHTALKKFFALKALPARLAQEHSFVSRFKREAEMIGRLKHAHIVNVTDFGESQGRLFLVLEYVDGGSLEDWYNQNCDSKTGGVSADHTRRFISQILAGLAHAHQAGIVHRDLKPANVLLEKTGEAKISDFGLARVVAEEEYRRQGGTAAPFQGDSVSTTGSIVGTIDFMSPEARNMQPSDARSDIYAVGVIAYHLLTGRKPHGMAKPPSQLKPGLDPRWDEFVATCLAEDPAQRYQTATAAQQALEQLLKPLAKKGSPVAMIAGAAVLVAGGVAAALFWPREKPTSTADKLPAAAPLSAPVAAPRNEAAPVEAKPLPPAHRAFALTGLPAGSIVTFRDRNHAVSAGGRVTLELPPGGQTVQVRAPGYQNWEGVVGGTDGETEVQIPIERVPPRAIRFTGLPAGAEVVTGDQIARSDANGVAVLNLHPGSATVTARAPKFESLDLAVDVRESTESFPVEMKRVPPPAEIAVALPDGGELKLRWIPAGEFLAGSPADERGRQRSDLTRARAEIPQGFYIATTEMTQRQHRALMGRNPSTSRALGDENRPVEQVAWRDVAGTGGVLDKCNDLLRRLNLPYKADLPTEVEWEYACRAGTETAFNDGSNLTNDRDDPALSAIGFYARGGSQSAPSPVGRLKPNRWGLFDMHGNVGEWAHGSRGPREPVLRGGNWKVGPALCRSASRTEFTPETRPTDTMGYRLVLRPTEQ